MTPLKRILGTALLAVLGLGVLAPNTAAQLSRVLASNVVGTFTSIAVKGGTGTAVATTGGTLFSGWTTTTCGTASLSNVGTAETDLCIYTMPANTLSTDGRKVRITAWGSYAADATSKILRGYFGSDANAPGVTSTTNGLNWSYQTVVMRTGASAALMLATPIINGAVLGTPQTAVEAISLTAPVIIKVTGTSATGGNEITLTGMVVEWVP